MVRGLALLLVGACHFQPGLAGGDGGVVDTTLDVARSWWNPAWGVRVPLTIANTSQDDLAAGYQVGLAFAVDAAPCTASADDPRIVYGSTELPRVIDAVGPPAWTWFPLHAPLAAGATSAGEYFLYCGNPAPDAAPSDPRLVFDLYDPFDALDSATWTANHTVAIASGELVCGGGTGDSGVVSATQWSANHAIDFVAASSSTTQAFWWGGFQNGTADSAPWVLWWTPGNSTVNPGFQGLQSEALWNGTTVPLDTAPHLYGVENYGTSSRYRRDDVPFDAHDYTGMTLPPAMMSVRLWNSPANTTLTIDWVRVRQAVDPPPAVTVGSAETY